MCFALAHNTIIPLYFNTYVAASFSLPPTAIANEGNSILPICVTMATDPPLATLAIDVMVAISTVNGTGTYV